MSILMLPLAIALASAGILLTGCTGQRVDDEPTAPEVRIHVPADGPLELRGEPVEIDALRSRLSVELEAGTIWPDSRVYVIGDADTSWERLRQAYGKVLAAGLRDVKIASREAVDSQKPEQP